MQPVGLPDMAWMPPYVAQVPAPITASALGARRSIHSAVVMGWPVSGLVPRAAQYPSLLIFSFGIDPSTTRTNGSNLPLSASNQCLRKSPPHSYASTGLCKCTFGSPGMAPKRTSSMLGCIAAVTDTESPSQLRPDVIQMI